MVSLNCGINEVNTISRIIFDPTKYLYLICKCVGCQPDLQIMMSLHGLMKLNCCFKKQKNFLNLVHNFFGHFVLFFMTLFIPSTILTLCLRGNLVCYCVFIPSMYYKDLLKSKKNFQWMCHCKRCDINQKGILCS